MIPHEASTLIVHVSRARDAAEEIRREIYPHALVLEGTPKDGLDIEVVLGKDFVNDHALEIAALSLIDAFLERRTKGSGAESYVSGDAADHYESGTDGLSLYGYAGLPALDFQEMKLTENEGLVEVALVPIWGETAYMDDTGPLVEILQVGWVADLEAERGRRLAIVGVHRDTFPFPMPPENESG
jgi:hypothetical protein